MQGANYILPFITIPYLVRTIGIDKYGLVAFAQSFAAYFVIFTDYGFSLSATKLISINRNDCANVVSSLAFSRFRKNEIYYAYKHSYKTYFYNVYICFY